MRYSGSMDRSAYTPIAVHSSLAHSRRKKDHYDQHSNTQHGYPMITYVAAPTVTSKHGTVA